MATIEVAGGYVYRPRERLSSANVDKLLVVWDGERNEDIFGWEDGGTKRVQ